MDLQDIAEVETHCSALRSVSPVVLRPDVKVRYGRDEVAAQLEGVSAAYHTIRNFDVEIGRPFSLIDVERAHQVCIVGREVIRRLGAGGDTIGKPFLLDGRRFQVIGILKEKGGLVGNSQDDLVQIPYTMALKMYHAQRRKVAFVARAASEAQIPEARAQIVNLLRRRHGLDVYQPNDFQILVQDEILETFNNLGLVAGVVLAGMVGISLLVGGIGIMNVMLVGVSERTREIGLRKAVGARRRDILLQFLTESVTLCLVGGGIGIVLGHTLLALASLHPRMVDVAVPPWAVALGFGMSAGTGTVFGLLPAVKAAMLNPIDALRHE